MGGRVSSDISGLFVAFQTISQGHLNGASRRTAGPPGGVVLCRLRANAKPSARRELRQAEGFEGGAVFKGGHAACLFSCADRAMPSRSSRNSGGV